MRNGDEWSTPKWLFNKLNSYYEFEMDMAANEHNSKCGVFSSNAVRDKKLIARAKTVWCNPPYSRGNLIIFVDTFTYLSTRVSRLVTLLPVDTSTGWFLKIKHSCKAICFISQRLSFGSGEGNAMQPSMLVILGTAPLNEQEFNLLNTWGEIWVMED